MAFPSFFNKDPAPAIQGTGVPAPAAPADPAPAPAPAPAAPDPIAIPEKADLAFFNNLVKETAPAEPGTPVSVAKDILNPENMKKIAAAQDFSAYIPQETLKKLQEGDQGAMMEAVQAMSSAAYSTALSQTGTILDTVLAQREGVIREQVRSEVLGSIANKEVTSGIPGIESPVVKNMAEMVSTNLRTQFPNASPDQIRGMTQQYFSEVNNAMNPSAPKPPTEAEKTANTDWMAYAGFSPTPT